MKKYLLDTNICISLIKNRYGLRRKIESIGEWNCAVSEITLDNFDLMIGASSIHNGMVMVTSNTKHFERIPDIKLEDWCADNESTFLLNEPEVKYYKTK